MIDRVLNGVLTRIEGATCVLLAGADGVVVTAVVAKEGPAPDLVAASLADLFRRVAVAHRDAGLAPPMEFTSGSSSGQAALRTVTPRYLLVAVSDTLSGLGRTRFELRKAAAELEPELI